MLSAMESGTLHIVATPIGNLEDVTLRALRILAEVDVIFCEDTRVTRRLLDRNTIHTPLKSLNARTESTKIDEVLTHLRNGENVAYVSDAGTPAISDPGTAVVSRAREEGFSVVTIPGASAVTAALSIVGLPSDQFTFLGFLPHKKGRQTLLKEIAGSPAGGTRTVVLYESTHRILKLLNELEEHLPKGRTVCIARELTKIFEEVQCGTPAELRTLLSEHPEKQKGEFVVIIASR